MKSGVILQNTDIKTILAKLFNVSEDEVIPTKYSWMIMGVSEDEVKKALEKPINMSFNVKGHHPMSLFFVGD